MATGKQSRPKAWAPKEWACKRAVKKALFSPRAEEAWCSSRTAFWLMERTKIDIPIPGTSLGDVPGGKKLAGSWDGLIMCRDDMLRPGVVVARREERTYHVRLDEGEVHEGRPEQCDHGVCLAETVMGE